MTRALRLAVAVIVAAATSGIGAPAPASAVAAQPQVVQLNAGPTAACAVTTVGTVWCWGGNSDDILSDGTGWNSSIPVPIAGITGARMVDVSTHFACAVRADGTVACWGNGDHGELGDGLSHHSAPGAPVTVGGVAGAVQVATGRDDACALTVASEIWCWGLDDQGQLGQGTVTGSLHSLPVKVNVGLYPIAVAMGEYHACALLFYGEVSCWGVNDVGQAGTAAPAQVVTPTIVAGIEGVVELKAGGGTTCARLADSTLRCWGLGTNGQLGNGGSASSSSPVVVFGSIGTTGLDVGMHHVCGTIVGGLARCWGSTSNGETGNDAASHSGVDATKPVLVETAMSFTSVTAGGSFTCALDAQSAVACWGAGGQGQTALGISLTAIHLVPEGVNPAFWDVLAPATTRLSAAPGVGARLSGTAVPLRVTAVVTDDASIGVYPSGPGGSRFAVSLSGGAWHAAGTAFPSTRTTETDVTATSSVVTNVPSGGYATVRVTPVDRAGNAGAARTSARLSVGLVQEAATAIRFSGSWTRQSSTGFSGGAVRFGTLATSSVTYGVTATSIGWVTTKGPNRGAAKVYVDGVLKATVDTYSATTTTRVIAWQQSWATAGFHTVRIVVLGTVGRPRVDLDAFVVVK